MIIKDDEEGRRRAGEAVADARVVAFRSDTFYGLGADPLNRQALRRLIELKGRTDGKPILLLVSEMAETARFVAGGNSLFEALAGRWWPGPLTIVSRAHESLPDELTGGTGTIGVRLPADEEVRRFVRACGGALTATSANPAARPPARTAAEVHGYFPEGLAVIVDGGAYTGKQPSTVVAAGGAAVRLIREGVLTREELRKELERIGIRFEERDG